MTKKRVIFIIVFLLLIIGVPVGVYLAQQRQDIKQHASVDESLVATVDGAPITEQDVKTAALQQYNNAAINQQTLSDTLNTIVKARLVEAEAKKRGITLTDTEINERASQLAGSESAQPSVTTQARFELLKEKLSKAFSKTREVESVGFWLPPDNYGAPLTTAEKQTVASQKAQKTAVLADIEQKFDANEEPLAIAQEIQKKYPLFAPLIAVNGYVLAKTDDKTVLTTSKLYTYQDAYKTNTFLSQIFQMTDGQVKTILTDANAGGVVVKVMNSTNGQYTSFADWLSQNTSSRTKIIKQP